MPINFLRHYYDVYKLLENEQVINFIGTDAYQQHKQRRFRQVDEINIKNNTAFTIPDKQTREKYAAAFVQKKAMYFKHQSSFAKILDRIGRYIDWKRKPAKTVKILANHHHKPSKMNRH